MQRKSSGYILFTMLVFTSIVGILCLSAAWQVRQSLRMLQMAQKEQLLGQVVSSQTAGMIEFLMAHPNRCAQKPCIKTINNIQLKVQLKAAIETFCKISIHPVQINAVLAEQRQNAILTVAIPQKPSPQCVPAPIVINPGILAWHDN